MSRLGSGGRAWMVALSDDEKDDFDALETVMAATKVAYDRAKRRRDVLIGRARERMNRRDRGSCP